MDFGLGVDDADLCEAYNFMSDSGQSLGASTTLAIPTLLARLGPLPGFRRPLAGVLARRGVPNISCASASFFLRWRSFEFSGAALTFLCLDELTGLNYGIE